MRRDGVAGVEIAGVGIVDLAFDVLCVLDAEKFVYSFGTLLSDEARNGVEQVTGGFARYAQTCHIWLDGECVCCRSGHTAVGMAIRVAESHYEVVFIAVSQQGICRSYLVDEIDG